MLPHAVYACQGACASLIMHACTHAQADNQCDDVGGRAKANGWKRGLRRNTTRVDTSSHGGAGVCRCSFPGEMGRVYRYLLGCTCGCRVAHGPGALTGAGLGWAGAGWLAGCLAVLALTACSTA